MDKNQSEVVIALRKAGATVQPIHTIGKGVPDLLVGWRGRNYLFEVKDGDKPPSDRQLTSDERTWHRFWGGQVAVVENPTEAVQKLMNLGRLAA